MKNISNLLTSLNLFCGFSAIFFAFEGRLMLAFYAVFMGLIFDMTDGRIARALGITSRFGMEFDSLADVVTFGVAPSVIIYSAFLKNVEFGKLIAFFQTLAVAIRLARFNVTSSEKHKEYFEGLSSPMGAFILISWFFMFEAYGISFRYFEFVSSVFVFIIGFLEVSRLRFRTFKEVKFSPYVLFVPPFLLWLLFFKYKLFLLLVFFLGAAYIVYNVVFENYGKGLHIRHDIKGRRAGAGLFDDSRGKDKDGAGAGEAGGGHNRGRFPDDL